EMHAIEIASVGKLVDDTNELRRAEPELGFLAATLGPAAGAFREELDANADVRPHVELGGDLEQHVHLAHLLHHDEDFVAELLAHEGEAHELLVLVAVADDRVARRFSEPEHGLQLRLAAAFQSHAKRLAELHDLLDDVALLVNLDRVN